MTDYPLIDVLNQLQPLFTDTNSAVVVHLFVKDFYRHNYNDILKRNFTFAGNIGKEKEIGVCRSTTANKTNVLERCHESTERQRHAKLVSENVINFPKLYEVIHDFDVNNSNKKAEILECKPLIIGVCGDISDEGLLRPYDKLKMQPKVKLRFERTCENITTERMVALLTPKPFEPPVKFITTTIFYNEQRITSPETTDMIPNSFSSVDWTEKMKFAFLKFMQERDWNRVAILSDDSAISKEFARGLTSLFEKANIVYASESCEVINCNFHKMFNRLIMAEAKVIIANVGEEYVMNLTMEASRWHTEKKGFVWLFRSQQVAKNVALWTIGDVYSITLGPMIPQGELASLCNSKPCNILAALEAVMRFLDINYDKIIPEHLTDINTQRTLAAAIKTFLDGDGIIKAYVSLYQNNNDYISHAQVAEMTIAPSNAIFYQKLGKLPDFRPELSDCTIKSDVYFKKCNDEEVMLIMLVVAVFALTLLGIVYFFQMSQRSYSRMSC